MTDHPAGLDLAAIEGRAATTFFTFSSDTRALLAEVRRLRAVAAAAREAWVRVTELAPTPWDALGASRLVAPGFYTVVDGFNQNVIYADSDELADALVALSHALDGDAPHVAPEAAEKPQEARRER